jgi:hypothetical protein
MTEPVAGTTAVRVYPRSDLGPPVLSELGATCWISLKSRAIHISVAIESSSPRLGIARNWISTLHLKWRQSLAANGSVAAGTAVHSSFDRNGATVAGLPCADQSEKLDGLGGTLSVAKSFRGGRSTSKGRKADVWTTRSRRIPRKSSQLDPWRSSGEGNALVRARFSESC